MNSSDPVTKKAVVRPVLGASDTATHGYSQKHVPASLACAEVPTLFFTMFLLWLKTLCGTGSLQVGSETMSQSKPGRFD